MIQFLGIDISRDRVRAATIGRDLALSGEFDTPVAGAGPGDAPEATVVSATEWVRAAAYAAREAYQSLPVEDRQLWGVGLSSPPGWIALDREYAPLTDVRLTDDERIAEDIARWLDEDSRRARKVSVILSPKDYFRFVISGGLAADVTHASRQGLLREDERDWSSERVRNTGLSSKWLPPVFRSDVATGRISEDGMRRTGLPGGLWVVAGSTTLMSAMVSAGDLREEVLWAPAGADRLVCGIPRGLDVLSLDLPEGWSAACSAVGERTVIQRCRTAAAGRAGLDDTAGDLRARGVPVERVETAAGRPEVGAAVVAAVGSPLIKSWAAYFQKGGWRESSES